MAEKDCDKNHDMEERLKIDRANNSLIETLFEGAIWRSRFVVIFAVVFSLLGAFVLFIVASMDIWNVAVYTFNTVVTHAHPENFHEDVVAGIIGAVDLYLIAVVMFIFAFGIYELFISEIDEASGSNGSQILAIHSLDQLKDKIAKVIVMVLVVNFFQRVLHTNFTTPLEMLYFALSITALAVGLYFLGKVGK
ncbi:MAG: Arginine/ornithine antiporter ArcD [uncultured Sulfurovum sp.]|uniref:Arginine/ornithine antiporter ArcD n=1 Tax=uncultured Sulfurovum sp. TaxID=269237 RepID=A0A6S6TBC3_9BACT|nr:MAG: Arginine/ornithine antiporter ArcD [uncultured Sulfurovum sp.]